MSTEVKLHKLTSVDQLVSSKGMTELNKSKPENPFTTTILNHRERFIGKKDLLLDIEGSLLNHGIAIVAGGHRSGKSELMKQAAQNAIKNETVETCSFVTFDSYLVLDDEDLDQEINDNALKPLTVRRKGLVIFDEIETLDGDRNGIAVESVANKVNELVKSGHKVIISVNGDLYSEADTPDELSLPSKRILQALVSKDNNIIKNRQLTDVEIREIITGGNESLFTNLLVEYLVKQAGGHPIIAQEAGFIMFELLKDLLNSGKFLYGLLEKFNEELERKLPSYFNFVVENIIDVGYDPTDWTWNGQDGKEPSLEIYQNMIPRASSTIFQKYLKEYLINKN